MNILSLFTGTGALDLAAQSIWPTSKVMWHSEINKSAKAVIAHHAPQSIELEDITNVSDTTWRQLNADIITAGWPCQPFSVAGNRKGIADERALWPYVDKAIRLSRPRHILLENVAAVLSRTGEFDRVLTTLAECGYESRWLCLRASDAGAPHRRSRLFITAHRDSDDTTRTMDSRAIRQLETRNQTSREGIQRPTGRLSRNCREAHSAGIEWGKHGPAIRRWETILNRAAPIPYLFSEQTGTHVLSAEFAEFMMGLPEGWVTDPGLGLTRRQQIKLLGNSVVPQQAHLAHTIMSSWAGPDQ